MSSRTSDYQPGFEKGMQQQLAEIAAIAGNKAAPSFDNTIAAMERSGRMLERVNNAFFGVVQANTNPCSTRCRRPKHPNWRRIPTPSSQPPTVCPGEGAVMTAALP